MHPTSVKKQGIKKALAKNFFKNYKEATASKVAGAFQLIINFYAQDSLP